MKKLVKDILPTKFLLKSLIILITIGAFLLKLPICNKTPIKLMDSIFMATSAICVTGLTTVVPIEQFTLVGQVVLLVLIQIGGIGLMTLISIVLISIGKKLNLSDKLIIRESLNQNTFEGLVNLIKKICIYTLVLESIGVVILGIRFIPDFGVTKGIWYSIFHSISAFCNAGFDLIGKESFEIYANDWFVCVTIMGLIIIGGLGFTVWEDIVQNIKSNKKINQLTVHTKIVLLTTAILLIIGTILILIFESDNLYSLNNDNLGTKLLKAAFQSTTLRTAGFSTITQNQLTSASKLLSVCLMFIGGSPASMAGGIKTVTLGVIVILVVNYIKGRQDVTIFNRTISTGAINRAIVVLTISMFIIVSAISILLMTENFGTTDIIFEVVSAFATVGLTLGITTNLSIIGKIMIISLMIIGRLGPITISIALFKKHKETKQPKAQYPMGNVLIG